jgi:hypothetical protein
MAGIILAQVSWDDLSDPTADTAITTHHYEAPITPPGNADALAFVNVFNGFFTALQSEFSSDIQVNQIRFYAISAVPGTPSGDPFYIDTTIRTGNSTGMRLPPQCAISVTEGTAMRRRWGRFYLPGFTVNSVGPGGRVLGVTMNAIANAADVMYQQMSDTGREFAVLRQIDRTYQLVRELRVDDVWDIIRRRRHSVTLARQIRSTLP